MRILIFNLNQQLFCTAVSGANAYRFRVNGPNVSNYVYTHYSTFTNFYMTWIPGVLYTSTYTVEVAARVGSVWGSYGSVCNITTPSAVPNTQVSPCPGSASLNTQLFCISVPGATNYKWKVTGVTNPSYINERLRGSNFNNDYLSWHTGIVASQTYNVEVKAYVSGVWGNYSTVCTIVVPVANPDEQRVAFDGQISDDEMLNVFPNPFSDIITLTSENDVQSITIVNTLGETVYSAKGTGATTEINLADLKAGIYFIKAETAEGNISRKIIKL